MSSNISNTIVKSLILFFAISTFFIASYKVEALTVALPKLENATGEYFGNGALIKVNTDKTSYEQGESGVSTVYVVIPRLTNSIDVYETVFMDVGINGEEKFALADRASSDGWVTMQSAYDCVYDNGIESCYDFIRTINFVAPSSSGTYSVDSRFRSGGNWHTKRTKRSDHFNFIMGTTESSVSMPYFNGGFPWSNYTGQYSGYASANEYKTASKIEYFSGNIEDVMFSIGDLNDDNYVLLSDMFYDGDSGLSADIGDISQRFSWNTDADFGSYIYRYGGIMQEALEEIPHRDRAGNIFSVPELSGRTYVLDDGVDIGTYSNITAQYIIEAIRVLNEDVDQFIPNSDVYSVMEGNQDLDENCVGSTCTYEDRFSIAVSLLEDYFEAVPSEYDREGRLAIIQELKQDAGGLYAPDFLDRWEALWGLSGWLNGDTNSPNGIDQIDALYILGIDPFSFSTASSQARIDGMHEGIPVFVPELSGRTYWWDDGFYSEFIPEEFTDITTEDVGFALMKLYNDMNSGWAGSEASVAALSGGDYTFESCFGTDCVYNEEFAYALYILEDYFELVPGSDYDGNRLSIVQELISDGGGAIAGDFESRWTTLWSYPDEFTPTGLILPDALGLLGLSPTEYAVPYTFSDTPFIRAIEELGRTLMSSTYTTNHGTFDVDLPAGPDLIATNLILPSSGTVDGVSHDFDVTIENIGGVAAPSSTASFEIDLNNDDNWTTLGTAPVSALDEDQSIPGCDISDTDCENVSINWTTVVGTHKFRVTADSADVISEGDETNNVLISGTFTIVSGGPPIIIFDIELGNTLTSSNGKIFAKIWNKIIKIVHAASLVILGPTDDTVTLKWTVTGADECNGNQPLGSSDNNDWIVENPIGATEISPVKPFIGEQLITPISHQIRYTFELICSNSFGSAQKTTEVGSCGDGTIQGNAEQCDSGDVGTNQCTDLGGGYTGGILTCDNSTCTYNISQCTSLPPLPKQCNDGIDNDGDGAIDLADGGCLDANDDIESNCGDGICYSLYETPASCPADCRGGGGEF